MPERAQRGGLFRAALRRAGFGVAALLLGGLAWNFFDFLARIEQTEQIPARHADGAVALTGGADRISDALDLLSRGVVDRLLITGVNPATSKAELVRQSPHARALFDCCIELGYMAANTIGNAAETERWVRLRHIRSLVVVTSNYHMPRAMAEIASALPDVQLVPFPVVAERTRNRPWWSDGASTRLILWEYCKYVAARVRLQLVPGASGRTEEAAARGSDRS